MNVAALTAVMLASGALLGSARLLWRARRAGERAAPTSLRLVLLVLGQGIAALLLYLTMFPPSGRAGSSELTVVTANVSTALLDGIDARARVVALPEAPDSGVAERVPDLATALRRFPSTTRLIVVGAGLPARDREVASRYDLEFESAPLPIGVIELWSPQRVLSGSAWQVAGQVNAAPGATVDLIDPSQQRIASATPGDDGRFVLGAVARTPGRESYRLRLRDAAEKVLDDIEVAVQVETGTPLRALVLSGAPSPDLKYLRRWALDAGVDLSSGIQLRPGVRLLRSAPTLTPAALSELDLVILDERALQSLGAADSAALTAALRSGLGMLIRITGPLSERGREQLRQFGFALRAGDVPRSTRLAGLSTSLARQPVQVEARDGVALVSDEHGEPLALWRAEGQGRIALWWLSDSFRLALDGAPGAYGSLWSKALNTVTRARGARAPQFPDSGARVNQRQVICEVDSDATVLTPEGQRIPLLREASGCAAYWPEAAGRHVLSQAGSERPFNVRTAGEAPAMLANELRSATAAIATAQPANPAVQAPHGLPGSPWPYFLASLFVLGGTWWLERFGRRAAR